MALFSPMPGIGGPSLGGGASPSAFTAPGMDPMQLAMLLRMQGGGAGQPGAGPVGGPVGGAGGPQMPQPPQPMSGGGPMGMGALMAAAGNLGQAGQPGAGGNQSIMQMLQQTGALGNNGLQGLLQSLFGHGAGFRGSPQTLNSLPDFGVMNGATQTTQQLP